MRCAPISLCGCIRDPGHDSHSCPDELSPLMVEAGRDAARHIMRSGCTPILKTDVLRELWRRGGDDRDLAELLLNRKTHAEAGR